MALVWTILIIYMLLLLGVSIYARRFVKDVSDFLLAGRSMGVVLVTATLAATHFGGGFILGEASWGAKFGIGGVWYGFACGAGLVILGLTLAEPMRALALYTVPEILERRYRSKAVKLFAAALSLTALVGILGAQVWASSAVFETLGFNGTSGAIVAVLLFVAYTAFSGMWAVALTDIVQVVIGTVGVIVATVMAWSEIGGLSGLKAALAAIPDLPQSAEHYFSFASPGMPLIILTLAATTMYTLIGQDFYQRLFSAKSPKVARIGAVASGVFLMLLSFVPALAGMLALGLTDDPQALLAQPKTAIPQLLLITLGTGLGGLFLAAILAAVMSTADSMLTAATAHVVKDFYQGWLKPSATEKEMLYLSRIATIAVGIVALIAALKVQNIVSLLIYSYDFYTAGVFIPLIVGLCWQRATASGALAGIVAGLSLVLLGVFEMISFAHHEYIYICGALASLFALVVVSLCTKQQEPSSADQNDG